MGREDCSFNFDRVVHNALKVFSRYGIQIKQETGATLDPLSRPLLQLSDDGNSKLFLPWCDGTDSGVLGSSVVAVFGDITDPASRQIGVDDLLNMAAPAFGLLSGLVRAAGWATRPASDVQLRVTSAHSLSVVFANAAK